MDFNLWLAFASACILLSVIPGPSVLVVMSQSISNGWRAAVVCIAGEVLGGVCLMMASLLGVGAMLATSPMAFQGLKWFGVGFLLYLGIKALRCAITPDGAARSSQMPRGSFSAGFWTSVLNPKSLVFYLAFFAQFVDAGKPLALQYMLLVVTAATVAGAVLGVYALVAVRLKPMIAAPSAQRKVSGVSGVLYISGGALVAVSR